MRSRSSALNLMSQSATYVAVVKDECETCHLAVPVLAEIHRAGHPLTVFWQDDGRFLGPGLAAAAVDDRALERSFHLAVETVPTLIRLEGGAETGRTVGWSREDWRALTAIPTLGAGLPLHRPGCGSRSVEPGVAEALRVRFGETGIRARTVEVPPGADAIEACYDRGWSDGLPVVPPTPERILRMLAGTRRDPHEIIGRIPPELAPCTVEKVAINAVHGRVPPRIHAGRARGPRGRPGPGVHPARRHLQHLLLEPGDHRQRPRREAHRHELRTQRARAGEPGQRHHRPRGEPRGAQCGRRAARRNRPRDAGLSGQVHVLLRGG